MNLPCGDGAQFRSYWGTRGNPRDNPIVRLWFALRASDDFMSLFADRVYSQLFNDGALTVLANAVLVSKGGAKATFSGGNSATGTATASTLAVGMDGGEGDDIVVSTGDVEVRATTLAKAQNNASNLVSFTSDEIAGSLSEASADAIGLRGADGANMLVNEGNLQVIADSTAYAFSYASGASFSFDGDGEARATSTALATATGFSAGDGDNVVINDGQLSVTATAGTAEDLITTITSYRLQGDYIEDEDADEVPIADTVTELPDLDDPAVQAQYSNGDIVYCTDADSCIIDENVNADGNHWEVLVESVDDDGDPDTPEVDQYSWVVFETVDDLPDLDDPVGNVFRVDAEEGVELACEGMLFAIFLHG